MWEPVEINLPPELAFATTSVWLYPEVLLVGVMRRSFLWPPILWGQMLKAGVRNIREAPAMVTKLQELIEAPTVYAEAELDKPRNQAVLLYLGFKELPESYDRKLYIRSI